MKPEKKRCLYCNAKMERTEDPLPEVPNRVRYNCTKCGHEHFVSGEEEVEE
ncbi:hypothetical protein ACFLXE_00175 [Chloroflexota bacterium]